MDNSLYTCGPKELVDRLRAPMGSAKLETAHRVFDLCQPKYDGWFCIIRCYQGRMQLVVRSGVIQMEDATNWPDCILLGEWMHGTHWSQHPERIGKLFLFDIAQYENSVLISLPTDRRLQILYKIILQKRNDEDWLSLLVRLVPTYKLPKENPDEMIKAIWKMEVEQNKFEGLVFRRSSDPISSDALIGRIKGVVEEDYVLMAVEEGGGRNANRTGALVGGLYINGMLQSVCSVGGGMKDWERDEFWQKKDELIGKVFKATGNEKFPSGALRHPQFAGFREDKPADQCILRELE